MSNTLLNVFLLSLLSAVGGGLISVAFMMTRGGEMFWMVLGVGAFILGVSNHLLCDLTRVVIRPNR